MNETTRNHVVIIVSVPRDPCQFIDYAGANWYTLGTRHVSHRFEIRLTWLRIRYRDRYQPLIALYGVAWTTRNRVEYQKQRVLVTIPNKNEKREREREREREGLTIANDAHVSHLSSPSKLHARRWISSACPRILYERRNVRAKLGECSNFLAESGLDDLIRARCYPGVNGIFVDVSGTIESREEIFGCVRIFRGYTPRDTECLHFDSFEASSAIFTVRELGRDVLSSFVRVYRNWPCTLERGER